VTRPCPLVARGRIAQGGMSTDAEIWRGGLYGVPSGREGGSRTLLLTRGGKPWEGLHAAYDLSVMSTWS
jgi:hypothetical protein